MRSTRIRGRSAGEARPRLREPARGQPAHRLLRTVRVREDGPRAADPGYDFLVQAMAGFMSVTGDPGSPPTRCGVSVVDFSGGLASTVGLLIGLCAAGGAKPAVGCDVDVSPARHGGFDAELPTPCGRSTAATAWSGNRTPRTRRSCPRRTPHAGRFHRHHVHEGEVLAAAGRAPWAWPTCSRIRASGRSRIASRIGPRLLHCLQGELRTRTTGEWLAVLRDMCRRAPVYTVDEALRDEQVLARDMVVEVEHAQLGVLREVGWPDKDRGGVTPRYVPRRRSGPTPMPFCTRCSDCPTGTSRICGPRARSNAAFRAPACSAPPLEGIKWGARGEE